MITARVAEDVTTRRVLLALHGAPQVAGLDDDTHRRTTVAPDSLTIVWTAGRLEWVRLTGRNLRSGGAYQAVLLYAADPASHAFRAVTPLAELPSWARELVDRLAAVPHATAPLEVA